MNSILLTLWGSWPLPTLQPSLEQSQWCKQRQRRTVTRTFWIKPRPWAAEKSLFFLTRAHIHKPKQSIIFHLMRLAPPTQTSRCVLQQSNKTISEKQIEGNKVTFFCHAHIRAELIYCRVIFQQTEENASCIRYVQTNDFANIDQEHFVIVCPCLVCAPVLSIMSN